MDKILIEDIIDWDVSNWSKAIDFWEDALSQTNENIEALELGGNKGGLSLWLASKGYSVICSDLNSPEENAKELHKKYNLDKKIQYAAIDATAIPFDNKFDAVAFKSILGGISGGGKDHLMQKTIDDIYKSLKPGGVLFFAENLESSAMHRFIRKRFVSWGARWNYLKYKDIEPLFQQFSELNYQTIGFFGTFGRTEKQRRMLSKLDKLLSKLIPQSKKYIVFGTAKK